MTGGIYGLGGAMSTYYDTEGVLYWGGTHCHGVTDMGTDTYKHGVCPC